jgi:alpha-tubulin suppressor-like RCC1 family protein
VSAGGFSAAITDKGDLYVWGNITPNSECILPSKVKQISDSLKEIQIGNSFAIALTKSGKTYSWGSNTNGQLGQG